VDDAAEAAPAVGTGALSTIRVPCENGSVTGADPAFPGINSPYVLPRGFF
jgi:hypothetical protein